MNNLLYLFDEQEFVIVCRKTEEPNNIAEKELFLVSKGEWEDIDNDPTKTFDLLLTSIENNSIKLYPAPNNAVIIFKSLPYSEKSNYMEIPR